MQFSFRLLGQKEIIRRLSLMPDATAGKALSKAAMAGAKVIVSAAKARAPVRTHKLQESITAEVTEKSRDHVEAKIGPGKSGFYGMFHELGTSKMPARPFLRPVLDESEEQVIQAVWRELEAQILKAART